MKYLKYVAMVGLCLVLRAGVGEASVTPNSVVTAQTPSRGIVQFLQGTDTALTYKTLYTAGANGSRCNGMWATNSDSVNHLITVQIVNTAVKYGGTAVTVPTTAGFANGVPAQALMTAALWPGLPLDSDGNPFIALNSGDTLQATFATAFVTGSTVVNAVVACADF